ncbi:MAG: acetate uptake transporter [Candidatus Cloacimonadales bacterium]
MNETISRTITVDAVKTANPAPIGLIGFGMTTILLNIHNAGYFELDTAIMAMGMTIGGIAQILAGAMEWKKNNTFGTVAFTAYGFFWISLVMLLTMPKLGLGTAPNPLSMGFYLTLWGIFTAGMFACTFKLSRISRLVFGSLMLLFALLALSDFTGNHTIKIIAGFVGILCGAFAMYDAIGQVVNEVYERNVLPL